MMHAVIIDDELNGLKSLELLLEDMKDSIRSVAATTDAIQGIEMINSYRPDIVFLDISMPQLDGFEVLERLSFKDFHLVFTTAHKQYALRALKLGAIDYLLKPVDKKELATAVNRILLKTKEDKTRPDVYEILRQLTENKRIKVLLPSKKSTEYVNPEDIVYIEANLNNSIVALTNGQNIAVITNLKDFEQQLCSGSLGFMRIHHSYIINIDYVMRYIKDDGGFVSMRGKKTIPISRQKKEQLLKSLRIQG